jgi:hypothetical protein
MGVVSVVGDLGTKIFQQRIWNTRIEVYVIGLQRIVKK